MNKLPFYLATAALVAAGIGCDLAEENIRGLTDQLANPLPMLIFIIIISTLFMSAVILLLRFSIQIHHSPLARVLLLLIGALLTFSQAVFTVKGGAPPGPLTYPQEVALFPPFFYTRLAGAFLLFSAVIFPRNPARLSHRRLFH